MFSLERLTSLLTDLVVNKEAIEEDSAAMKAYAKVMDNVGDRLSQFLHHFLVIHSGKHDIQLFSRYGISIVSPIGSLPASSHFLPSFSLSIE